MPSRDHGVTLVTLIGLYVLCQAIFHDHNMSVAVMSSNRPHYYLWKMAAGGRAFFRVPRVFTTRQNAQKYAARRNIPPHMFMVRQCLDNNGAACPTR